MLALEPEIVATYVATGQVRLIFWPVLNHGDPSLYATIAAECAGQQAPALFWALHGVFFERQNDLWRATRDDFIADATAVGAEPAAFARCYDDPATLQHVLELDAARRARGIFSQPVFDINGTFSAGSGALLSLIAAALP